MKLFIDHKLLVASSCKTKTKKRYNGKEQSPPRSDVYSRAKKGSRKTILPFLHDCCSRLPSSVFVNAHRHQSFRIYPLSNQLLSQWLRLAPAPYSSVVVVAEGGSKMYEPSQESWKSFHQRHSSRQFRESTTAPLFASGSSGGGRRLCEVFCCLSSLCRGNAKSRRTLSPAYSLSDMSDLGYSSPRAAQSAQGRLCQIE